MRLGKLGKLIVFMIFICSGSLVMAHGGGPDTHRKSTNCSLEFGDNLVNREINFPEESLAVKGIGDFNFNGELVENKDTGGYSVYMDVIHFSASHQGSQGMYAVSSKDFVVEHYCDVTKLTFTMRCGSEN